LFLGLITTVFQTSGALAAENGSTPYPGGNEDFMAGALPPAGTKVFLNYFTYYDADKLRDNAGRHKSIAGLGKTDFRLQAVMNAFRFVDVTKVKLLGGDLVWHVIVPMGYQHASLGAGPVDINAGSKTGLGDIEAGVSIGWHPSKTFHHVAGIDIVAPTGAYDKDDSANIGNNYWSFNPLWVFTYIGDKTSPIPGFEISAKLMYWINTINSATSYTSGQMFMADYLVGQHFGPWGLGINGHYLYQTTDDKQFGRTVDSGNRSKYLSAGPAVQYNFGKGSCMTVKYQFDVWEQNRPEGNKLWLKFIYPF
jgi:hypothetical protein